MFGAFIPNRSSGSRGLPGYVGTLRSIAVDSWGIDFGLLDSRRSLIQSPTSYRDDRRRRGFASTLEQIPSRSAPTTGPEYNSPINSVFELAAMASENDPSLSQAETFLLDRRSFQLLVDRDPGC